MSNLTKCSSCNKIFESSGTTYRCCDADVCSINCSFNRVQSVLKIDPTLTESHKWSNLTSTEQNDILIPFLTISQDNDNYPSSDFSYTTICEMCDIYNKAKIYVVKKMMDFVSVET